MRKPIDETTAVMIVLPQWDCYDLMRNNITKLIRAQRIVLRPPFRVYICCGKGDIVELHKSENFIGMKRACDNRDTKCANKVIGYADVFSIEEIYSVEGQYNLSEEDLKACGHSNNTLKAYGKGRKLHLWTLSDFHTYPTLIDPKLFTKPCEDPYGYCYGCPHGLVIFPSDVETSADLEGASYETVCLNKLEAVPSLYCYVRRFDCD